MWSEKDSNTKGSNLQHPPFSLVYNPIVIITIISYCDCMFKFIHWPNWGVMNKLSWMVHSKHSLNINLSNNIGVCVCALLFLLQRMFQMLGSPWTTKCLQNGSSWSTKQALLLHSIFNYKSLIAICSLYNRT